MSSNHEKKDAMVAIYDAEQLGKSKMLMLGIQHMLAMFGATILVPALTGLSVSSTLLFAGLGTLLFHFLTKGMVPAFLGSSFAFIAGYKAIAWSVGAEGQPPVLESEKLPYACVGVIFAGMVYLILAALIKCFGAGRVLKFFPPIVTGPIIIAIGLTLSASAVQSCSGSGKGGWIVALTAVVVVIICNIWGKGMIKIIPILVGVAASSFMAAILYITKLAPSVIDVDKLQALKNARWIGMPFEGSNTVFAIFKNPDRAQLVSAVITITPIAIATVIEHIGDISAISSTTGRNYFKNPGLHRTLLGDGLATIMASFFGAPANTTYGENTGVLSLTKVYDPKVIRIAAYIAVIFSFSPKFSALIGLMPAATIGGVSLMLYGMISAVGMRNIVESKVDFSKARNVIIAALIIVLSIGIKYGTATGSLDFSIGKVNVGLSGLAVGAVVGIFLNAVMPDGDDFDYGNVMNKD